MEEAKPKSSSTLQVFLGLALLLIFVVGVSLAIAWVKGDLSVPHGTQGTLQFDDSAGTQGSVELDKCVIRNDVTPEGFFSGKSSSYYSRVFTRGGNEPALAVLREIEHHVMAPSSLRLEHGFLESPTPEERMALARLTGSWTLLILAEEGQAPLLIEPERCTQLAMDMAITASRMTSADNSGTLSLRCPLGVDGEVVVDLSYGGCV